MSEFQQLNEALTALREEIKSSTPNQELIKKCNDFIDKHEVKNQELIVKLGQEKAAREDLEKKYSELEADFKRGNFFGEKKEAKTQEIKSFEQFLKVGKADIRGTEEFKYLRTDNNENGGYLAPSQYVNEIIKNITEISPVRQVARIIPISSKEIVIPKRTGLVSGGWVGEGQTATASNSTYGDTTLRANKMTAYSDVTIELLRDAAFDIQSQISQDVGEDFGQIEGAAFINGTGVNQPQGLLDANNGVGYYANGHATALQADALFEIQGEIKAGYNQTWMLNKKTLHQHVRILKNGSGDYIFKMGMGDIPNTIAGVPYVIANDMPDVAADAFPMIIGDYRKCYYIVDNTSIEAIEDPLTQAISGKRRYIFFKRTGGQVVLAEGLKKLKIATS